MVARKSRKNASKRKTTRSPWKIVKKTRKPAEKTKPIKTVKPLVKKSRKKTKKVIFLVVDGLADRMRSSETPLKKAKKPTIDWFAANGACGELSLITKSMWNKINHKGVSQYGNVSLLGHDLNKFPLDRGPLEAVGAGLPYKNGDFAIRFNFATVDGDMRVVNRRAGREAYGLSEIARQMNQHIKLSTKYTFMRTYGHRAVLIIKKPLSKAVRGNDVPVGEIVPRIQPLDDSEDAKETAKIVQEFIDKARNVIHYHPKNSERIDKGMPSANYILARQPGNKLPKFPDFAKKWDVGKAVVIAENGVMKSTCMLAGFSSINVPEFATHTEWLDFIFDNTDTALAEYDFVYIHVKGADESAHDKNAKEKQSVIEDLDRHLEPYKQFNGIVVITCDHITSSESGNHEFGKVPVVVWGKGIKKDSVKTFDEKSVKSGALGTMSGRNLLKLIFSK